MAKRNRVRGSWAARILREMADRLAESDEYGSAASCVRRAHKAADRLASRGRGRPAPRMTRIAAGGLAVALALAGGAAHAGSYGDSVCADLREQQPALRAPIAVICHFPVVGAHGELVERATYFGCSPLDDGPRLSPVEAETSDSRCANPFDGEE